MSGDQSCFTLRAIYFLNKINVYKALDGSRMFRDEWHLANGVYSAKITSILLKIIIYLNKNARKATSKYTQIKEMRTRKYIFVTTGASISSTPSIQE